MKKIQNRNHRPARIEQLEHRRYLAGDLVFHPAEHEANQPQWRIVGGRNTTTDEYEAVVALEYNGRQICGGTLVAPDTVVTAAHCVDEGIASQYQVISGRTDLRTNAGQVHRVTSMITHPDYDPESHNADIAILQLASSSTQTPVNYVRNNNIELTAPGVTATAVGWGAMFEFGGTVDVANEVQVPIVSNAEANRRESYDGGVLDTMLAAGRSGRDTCQGDSGGPLFVNDSKGNWLLAGVTSWGNGCARSGFPGIYTRVSSYASWISRFTDPTSQGQLFISSAYAVPGRTLAVQVSDADLIDQASLLLSVTTTTGDEESVLLRPISPGRFNGQIDLERSAVAVGDGKLNVDSRDEITFTYMDADDGTGTPITVTAAIGLVQDDHGDSQATATLLTNRMSGNIDYLGDVDWFRFSATADTDYSLYTSLDSLSDSILDLYDANGNEIATDNNSGFGFASLIEWTAPADGEYYLRARGGNNSVGSYDVLVRSNSGNDDHGSISDLATVMSVPGQLSARIDQEGDADWFSVALTQGQAYRILVELNSLTDSYLRVFDSNGETLLAENDDTLNAGSELRWTAPRTDTFYIQVSGFGAETGSYVLGVEPIEPIDDHGNSADLNSLLFPGQTISATLEQSGDTDWFRFTGIANRTYTFLTRLGSLRDSIVRVYNTTGLTVLAEDDDSGNGLASRIAFQPTQSGVYFVEVAGFTNDSGTYELTAAVDQGLAGDLTGDGLIDIDDVRRLCVAVRLDDQNPQFDIDASGDVFTPDVTAYLDQFLGGAPIGDANLDGQFDSADLVLVFTAGGYEDNEFQNSNWDQGDWNCDGEFDSSDLVAAFQTGGYQNDSRPLSAAIVDHWFRSQPSSADFDPRGGRGLSGKRLE
ncbi:MAG: trypsin-like serine protease [Pirellulaceae bacterium]